MASMAHNMTGAVAGGVSSVLTVPLALSAPCPLTGSDSKVSLVASGLSVLKADSLPRILIADDHAVVRGGVRALVESQPGWCVCAEAADGREAVEQTRRTKPDIVVMDISMPELNGLEATRQILKFVPETQVLILTLHESREIVDEAISVGAQGCVFKSDASSVLIEAISALLNGRTFFNSTDLAQTKAATSARDASLALGVQLLTAREREVLQLLAEGRSNKEIADRLRISDRTAETHRTHIMYKLKLHSMSELVRFAIRNRMISA